MLQVTKVKKIFHDKNVQVSTKALNMIRVDFNRYLEKMAERCRKVMLRD